MIKIELPLSGCNAATSFSDFKRNSNQNVLPSPSALVTPMTADEAIDFAQLEQFTEYLIANGVHGLIPLGSTGEYYALNPAERRQVLKTVIRAAAGRVKFSELEQKFVAACQKISPPAHV